MKGYIWFLLAVVVGAVYFFFFRKPAVKKVDTITGVTSTGGAPRPAELVFVTNSLAPSVASSPFLQNGPMVA